jgi:hypothetical protein
MIRSKDFITHAMKACMGRGGTTPLFLNIVARRRWVVNVTPRKLYSRERTPVTQRAEGPRGGLRIVDKRKISCSYWDSKPGPSSP